MAVLWTGSMRCRMYTYTQRYITHTVIQYLYLYMSKGALAVCRLQGTNILGKEVRVWPKHGAGLLFCGRTTTGLPKDVEPRKGENPVLQRSIFALRAGQTWSGVPGGDDPATGASIDLVAGGECLKESPNSPHPGCWGCTFAPFFWSWENWWVMRNQEKHRWGMAV